MKKFYILMLSAYCMQHVCAQANQTLSNLTAPTAVNAALLPKNNNNLNLGSANKSWKSIYLDSSLYIGGARFLASPPGKDPLYGTGNTAIGANALYNNTTGDNNVANGTQALYNNTRGAFNTANGFQSLYKNTTGSSNAANGFWSLYNNQGGLENAANGDVALYSNTTGDNNTANGGAALYENTTGNNNTADGANALYKNNNGNNNTAGGEEALYSNTSGSANVASGYQSLYNNKTGNSNIAIGWESLYYNESGSSNIAIGVHALLQGENLSHIVAIGDSALWWLNSGSGHCTALGSKAGWQNTSGSNNTYVGYHAGNTVFNGSSNTIIGYGADVSKGSISNATAIGNLAVAAASNSVRIGNSAVTSIGGAVGWTNFADLRTKKDIKENVPGLKFINLLKPVTYHNDIDKEESITGIQTTENREGKYDISEMQFTGFSAQDVERAAKQIGYDFSGVDAPKNDKDLYGLRYSDFVVPLVKAMQELSWMNDDKTSTIDSLKKNNQNLNSKLDALEEEVSQLKNLVLSVQQKQDQCSPCSAITAGSMQQYKTDLTDAASLQQNVPDPFNNSTTIGYSLPQKFSSAQIIITDKNGRQLKQINPGVAGKGTVTGNASTLASGAYNYALYVDGRFIASKQMELLK